MRRNEDAQISDEYVSPYDTMSLESMGAFMLFGQIDQQSSYEACEFILKSNILAPKSNALTMFVNSEGGSINDGFAIIDTMETSRLPIQTVGLGLIASMTLLIIAAGHKGTRVITKNAEIMAHQYSSVIEGKHHELMAVTQEYMRLEQLFIHHFKRHSSMSEKQIRDILFAHSDRYLTPQECKKFGLCDYVTEYAEVPKIKSSKR